MYACMFVCSARDQSLTHTRQASYHDGSKSILSKLSPGPHNCIHQWSWRWRLSSWLTLKPWCWPMGPLASLHLFSSFPWANFASLCLGFSLSPKVHPDWPPNSIPCWGIHVSYPESYRMECGSWWLCTPALLPLTWDHWTPVNQPPRTNQIPGAGSANLLINAFVYSFLFSVSCP